MSQPYVEYKFQVILTGTDLVVEEVTKVAEFFSKPVKFRAINQEHLKTGDRLLAVSKTILFEDGTSYCLNLVAQMSNGKLNIPKQFILNEQADCPVDRTTRKHIQNIFSA